MRLLIAIISTTLSLSLGSAHAATFEDLLQQAKEGDVAAMHNVGVAYANGAAVEKDYALAMRWFEQAASKGQHNSMYSLAIMYRFGQGVAVDLVKAYAWYSLAAEYIPKDADEWFIPRAKIVMYERRPEEVAALLSGEELQRAKLVRDAIGKQIHVAKSVEPNR